MSKAGKDRAKEVGIIVTALAGLLNSVRGDLRDTPTREEMQDADAVVEARARSDLWREIDKLEGRVKE